MQLHLLLFRRIFRLTGILTFSTGGPQLAHKLPTRPISSSRNCGRKHIELFTQSLMPSRKLKSRGAPGMVWRTLDHLRPLDLFRKNIRYFPARVSDRLGWTHIPHLSSCGCATARCCTGELRRCTTWSTGAASAAGEPGAPAGPTVVVLSFESCQPYGALRGGLSGRPPLAGRR